jgi:hypothetical protein
MESYIYLEPVSSVSTSFNSSATVRLPSSSDVITIDFSVGRLPTMTVTGQTKTLGSDYEIYYRIYLSDKFYATVNTKEIRNDVNPSLEADWAAFEPYTIESNNRSSSVASLVASRKYYSIERESGYLKRFDGNGVFAPKPSGRLWFETSDDMFDSANLTDDINADIAGMRSGTPQYAYVSMYIVMRSFDSQTLTPIYSTPTFINVFLLPSDVLVVPVQGVSINGYIPTPPYPAAVKLTANVTPTNATNKTVVWTLDNENIAGIRVLDNADNAIIVYSKTNPGGTVNVTVRTNDGGFTMSTAVDLAGIPVDTVDIDHSQLTLTVGSSGTLTTTISPSNAKDPTIDWSSSDNRVATVTPMGVVTAVAHGSAIITAKTTDGTEIVKTCAVTVN